MLVLSAISGIACIAPQVRYPPPRRPPGGGSGTCIDHDLPPCPGSLHGLSRDMQCLPYKGLTAGPVAAVPQEGKAFKSLISGDLPQGWADVLPKFTPEDKGLATRLHSQTMLNALETSLPGLLPPLWNSLPLLRCPKYCTCNGVWTGRA